MEELKYYTPDITDLRVGYEAEKKSMGGWVPFLFEQFTTFHEGDKLIDCLKREINEIRTPYLTKEQIEKEGWEDTGDHYLGFCNKQGVGLKYNFEKRKLSILKPAGGMKHELFIGTCPPINELRHICKLLGI